MANARYNRMNNQAPVQTELENTDLNVGRSAFDFSTIHSGNALIGALIPVDCFEVVPNEDIDISLSALVELRNPTTRNLLNGMRVYFHAYCNYLVDLWEGAKNFLDAGRSGTISLQRPRLVYTADYINDGVLRYINACTPMSLLNFLGLPVEYVADPAVNAPPLRSFESRTSGTFYNLNTGSAIQIGKKVAETPDYFPADCAFAYQRNWRDYYANQNLLQNNKNWFPDNEEHFILSYSCTQAVAINYGNEMFTDGVTRFSSIAGFSGDIDSTDDIWFSTPEPNNPATVVQSSEYVAPNLSGLKFRQFRGDRFTTALPFPDLIRGDIPVLGEDSYSLLSYLSDTGEKGIVTYSDEINDTFSYDGDLRYLQVFASDNSGTVEFHLNSSITMNDIRALETMTVFKERMARTSGEYNDMIEAQFGYNPHHHDRKGTYIGGFYQDFTFSSVVQTSESTATSHLGQKSGQGVSNGQGNIGHIHTRDFGWIQIYMSIVPDVMYTQGIPRQFSKKTQLEMYFPVFNNLAPQAILNKELFVSGNAAKDNDVFAYEDRYAEYKSRPNRVSGFMSLSHDVAEYDASKIMARRFTSTPALNSQFVTLIPENVDMSVFSVYDEPPFDFQVGINVRRVSPMPYTAVPGSMSSKLHA